MTLEEASAIASKPEEHDRSTLEAALTLLVRLNIQAKQRKQVLRQRLNQLEGQG